MTLFGLFLIDQIASFDSRGRKKISGKKAIQERKIIICLGAINSAPKRSLVLRTNQSLGAIISAPK
jgi:hypothetical protein